eukprot:Skav201863  [mRNA]  locus=scaffold3490:169753:173460:- [translate_table: standard]
MDGSTRIFARLEEPWRSKVDALLRCDSDVHFGRIIEVNDSGFLIEEALLEPFRGLTIDPHGATCAVSFPDAAGFSTGAWIGYSGLRDNDGIRTIQDGSIVWLIPSGDASTQVSTIQMFSGAYDGWSRAFAWLKHEGILDSIRTIKIDHDQGVSNVWAKEEVPILRDVQVAGIQPNFSAFSGTVDNRKWFNLLRSDDFTFMTLSPPCQPWSRGGRGTGLHSANGMSFLQAIAVVGQTRPQLVGCECADLIVHHDHFPVLKHAFLAQGYVMHWSTVTDIAQLTGCQRKRWLALFVRRDVQTLPVFGTFKISDTQVPKWSNDCFQFAVPDEIVEQLRLTPEQLHMYSQVQWFPPNKRHTLPANPTPADVLEARRLQPSAIMPTLCASYSQQHTLNREHLDTKGIFASLVECDGHWSFLSPLMFCGIFGTPQDQIVVLPVNIADSFKQLGNCIAPPHALLVILVGLSATAVFKQSIKQMIIKYCVMKFGLMCLDRSFVPAHLWPSSFGCTINDVPTPCDQSCVISSGDVLTVWGLQSERSAYSIANGPCLASDEAMWFALEINKTESNTFIMAPVILFTHDVNLDEALHRPIVSVGEAFFASVAQGRTPPICRLRGLILFSAHWFGLEVTFGDITEVKLVGCQDSQMSQIISTGIAGALRSVGMIVATTFVEFPAVHGLCGWALLHTWIQDHGPLPEWCDVDAPTIDAARLSFANLEDPASPVGRFACVVRSQFLQQQRTATGRLHFGGAENDDKKDTDMKQDPLQVADPWKMPTSNKQKQQGARWEDLVLPDDHPFFCKSGERMFQVQRQRINGKNGGLAFSTKSNIQSVLAANTTVDSALLVPVSDRSVFAKLCPVPSVSGPYEITVKDPILDQLDKRTVLVVQVKGDIIFKLTGDGYKAKLNVLRELVFEFDSRLVNKDVTQHMVQSPLENMKQKVADQFGLKDISLYGFRKQSKESEHVFMQIIGKVDSALRPNILEKSGLNELTVRDFVQKGDSPNDHSVIPRFFPMTKQGKDEAIRSSVGVTGFAGVLLTRRGVGVRCWHKNIGAMRQALMASDMRICSENLNTVPRIARESVGWPQNITPQEVVRACMHSVGQAPVPTKCYRSLGVVAWTLMFASEPSCTKFTATFNDETVEVLLLPTGSQIKPSQPRSKPKKGAAPPASQPHDEATTDRITALESRFSVLERRQDTIENRVQSGFDAVQDQLRQVLTAVAPRNQAQDSTGHTPPQKVARSS